MVVGRALVVVVNEQLVGVGALVRASEIHPWDLVVNQVFVEH